MGGSIGIVVTDEDEDAEEVVGWVDCSGSSRGDGGFGDVVVGFDPCCFDRHSRGGDASDAGCWYS